MCILCEVRIEHWLDIYTFANKSNYRLYRSVISEGVSK